MYLSSFQEFKIYIVEMTNLSRDALHIYAGLLVFLTVAFLHHRQLRSYYAILLTLLVAVGAELMDARDDLINYGHWRIDASLHDVINTCFWPFVIWVAAKLKIWKN